MMIEPYRLRKELKELMLDNESGLFMDGQDRGVEFPQLPEKQPPGPFPTLIDSESNQVILVEQTAP